MNMNITYNKERNNWRYVKVCDRCKKQTANVIRDDRKPAENELYICTICSSEMFVNEKMCEFGWIQPKNKLPTEGQEVEFIATYTYACGTSYRLRFQGHFRQAELDSHVMIFYAHSIGWGCEFAIDEVEYWMPKVPMPEEKK